jgi:hypothetical protein
MKIINEFFLATPEEYKMLDRATNPAWLLPSLHGVGVDGPKIVALGLLISRTFFEEELEYQRARVAWYTYDPLPGSIPLKTEFTRDVAGLCDYHLEQCGSAWALLDGWEAQGMERQDVLYMLGGMRRLAGLAVRAGLGMYVWLYRME